MLEESAFLDVVKGHSNVRETKKCSEMMDHANIKPVNVIQKWKLSLTQKIVEIIWEIMALLMYLMRLATFVLHYSVKLNFER